MSLLSNDRHIFLGKIARGLSRLELSKQVALKFGLSSVDSLSVVDSYLKINYGGVPSRPNYEFGCSLYSVRDRIKVAKKLVNGDNRVFNIERLKSSSRFSIISDIDKTDKRLLLFMEMQLLLIGASEEQIVGMSLDEKLTYIHLFS